jgi:hypothetical protein
MMEEHLPFAAVPGDEAEALVHIIPFDLAALRMLRPLARPPMSGEALV